MTIALQKRTCGHATDLAREAVEEGVDLIVAVGGDGTVNEVGRSLINTKSASGILLAVQEMGLQGIETTG